MKPLKSAGACQDDLQVAFDYYRVRKFARKLAEVWQ